MNLPFFPSLSSTRMLLRRWRRRSLKRGFVLVACILLLALITVLVIALLGFTRSEIQGDAAYENLGQARRNAEVGLRRAMQQLQEQTGPDRRITARAELLDSDPTTPVIDDVVHPYWTGVWRNPVNPASILSNLTNTSLNDLMTSRTGLLDSPVWLVSGNSTDGSAPDPLKDIDRPIRLVGSGSGPTDADQHVFAGLQDIKDNEDRLVGRFAFWVGDEGVKARADLGDPWRDQGSGASDPASRYSSEITQRANVEILDPGFSSAGGNNTFDSLVSQFQSKLGSWLQLQLLVPASDTDLLTERFHDLTAYSQGVLADVRAGGLKKDLSLAFEMTDADFLDTEEFGNGTAWSVAGGSTTKAPTPLGGGVEAVVRRGPLFTTVAANPGRTKYLFFEPGDRSDLSQVNLLRAGYIRGPSWHLLRDYYLLYKQPTLSNANPSAGVRVDSSITDTISTVYWGYQRVYSNRETVSGGVTQPGGVRIATDPINQEVVLASDNAIANYNPMVQNRATMTTVAPILTRLQFALGYKVRKDNVTLQVGGAPTTTQQSKVDVSISPVITVMNPFNHRISVDELQVVISDPNFSIRIVWFKPVSVGSNSYTSMNVHEKELKDFFETHYNRVVQSTAIRQTWILRLRNNGAKTGGGPIEFEPGESKVFSVVGPDGVMDPTDTSKWVARKGANNSQFWNDIRGSGDGNAGTQTLYVWLGPLANPAALEVSPCMSFVDSMEDPYNPTQDPQSLVGIPSLNDTNTNVPGQPNIDSDQVRIRINYIGRNANTYVSLKMIPKGASTATTTQTFILGQRGAVTSGAGIGAEEPSGQGSGGTRGLSYRAYLSYPSNNLSNTNQPGMFLSIAEAVSTLGWAPYGNIDAFLKPAKFAVTTSMNQTSTDFRVPILAGFNPRAYAAFRNAGYGSPYSGAETWELHAYPMSDWINLQLDAGAKGYWGQSRDSAEGTHLVPLFEIPSSPLISLGGLRHADISPVQNQSAYAIGESWAHPLVAANRTWSLYQSRHSIAATGRDADYQVNTVADWSYLANEAIWDRYFFSGLAPQPGKTIQQVADDFDTYSSGSNAAAGDPLPNARLSLIADFMDRTRSFRQHLGLSGNSVTGEAYQIPARRLLLSGAFNVNSVSKDAWKAMLGGRHGVRRAILKSTGYALTTDSGHSFFGKFNVPYEEDPSSLWQGGVSLTDTQLDTLAAEIVREVKIRGPFRDMSDFVNRRLVTKSDDSGDTRLRGALQAAIDRSSINTLSDKVNINPMAPSRDDGYNPGSDAGRREVRLTNAFAFGQEGSTYDSSQKNGAHEHFDATPVLAGCSKYLTQGDLLNVLGPTLAARSDTFRVRFYGEDVHPVTGLVQARAWGEAILQRTPEPVRPISADPLAAPSQTGEPQDPEVLGRRYKIVSMRWLDPSEI